MSNVVAVVQARLGSRRLPRKVLEALEGRPIIEWVLDAAREGVDQIVLAVPIGDRELVAQADRLGVRCVQGPEHDTLERFRLAAEVAGADVIVRLTGDCPLLDPTLVAGTVQRALARGCDHHHRSGYPRGTGDVETISRRALEMAAAEATRPWDREHVVPWIERASDRLDIWLDEVQGPLFRPDLRVCVDEPADLTVVRGVLERTQDRPVPVEEVIAVLDRDPSLRAINAEVLQATEPE